MAVNIPWRRVLWLVDFTLSPGNAAACVRWLNSFGGVELHVLHVAPPRLAAGVADLIPDETWRHDEAVASDAEVHAQLEEFAHAWRLGPDVTLALRRGRPAPETLRYAEEAAVDLIVMSRPSIRQRPLFEFTGVSMRLAIRAPCPILVIPEPQRRPARWAGIPQNH